MPDLTGTITTHLASGQPAFTTVTPCGPLVPSRPIPRDYAHRVYRQRHMVERTSYAAPTADSVNAVLVAESPAVTAYCCGDENFSDEPFGDIITFDRVWSTMPAARTEPGGTYAYAFPAIPTGSLGSPATVTAFSSASASRGYYTAPVFTVAAHGYAVGDLISVRLDFANLENAGGAVKVVSVTTDTFTTEGIQLFIDRGSLTSAPFNPGAFSTGTAAKLIIGRSAPRTIPSDTLALYSYALPGVTSGVATADAFPSDRVFSIIESDGEEVQTLSATSTPTADQYRALVVAGEYIVASSEISVYLGNVLQKRTLCVRAQ